jgi:CARDB protein
MVSSKDRCARALGRVLPSIAVALALALGSTADALAAGKPDLTVTKVSNPPPVLVGGAVLAAAVTTRDTSAPAGASRTGLYLSVDKRIDKGDTRLSGVGRVPALRPGRSSRVTIHGVVPKNAVAGAYYLLACADLGRTVRERSEVNDCRASAKRLALVARPKPLTVRMALDGARTARGTIGPAGGRLVAAGADGTVYTLSLPAGALAVATPVTMTPLASLAGSPVTGSHGVDITPDGVHPYAPATLTIAPKAGPPAAKRAAFSFDGAGGEFHLHPSSVLNGGIALGVPRFGGYGVGLADLAARRRIAAQHAPTATIDQLSQALGVDGGVSANARDAAAPQAAVAANSAFPRDQADSLALATYYGIQARLISGTVPEVDSALADYTWWSALVDGLGHRSPELFAYRVEIQQQFVAAVTRATSNARVHCAGQSDLNGLAELLSLRSINAALPGVGLPESEISSAIRACLRFSLDYEAEVSENEAGGDVAGDIVVDSTKNIVSLSVDQGSSFVLTGSLPLTVTKYTFFDYVCDQQGGTATPQAPGNVTIRLTPGIPYEPYVPGRGAAVLFSPPTLVVAFNHGSVSTTNACGLDGFSGGLYDKELPRDFSDLYNTQFAQFVLPSALYFVTPGQPFTVFDQTRPPSAGTESSGRILMKLTHDGGP